MKRYLIHLPQTIYLIQQLSYFYPEIEQLRDIWLYIKSYKAIHYDDTGIWLAQFEILQSS